MNRSAGKRGLLVALLCCAAPAAAAEIVLVQRGAPMRYLANATDPGLGSAWKDEAFDDGAWSAGSYGVGYETAPPGALGLIDTAVPAGTLSVYTRTAFSISDVSTVFSLTLGADYDDGFVVWLNGVEVYRSPEMPATTPAWNTPAVLHESSNGATPTYGPLHDVSSIGLAALHNGSNVLAVGVWNNAPTSSDLIMVPYLSMNKTAVITRGPYLQLGTPASMVIRWRTDTPSSSRVRFGSSPGSLTSLVDDASLTTEHVLTLSGLAPATRYYYSVGTTAAVLAGGDLQHHFVTAPLQGTATRIWVLGDSGTANPDARAVRDAYMSLTGPRHTDLWLMLGDNAYQSGTDAEYQAAVFDMYPEMLRTSVLWPTLGNHDGVAADSATQSGPYYDMFTLPAQAEAGGVASGTEAYYSFDFGDIHFICLDSFETDRSPAGAMLTWLQQDVAATDRSWVIAFWHHPPYSKGGHDSDFDIELTEMRANALPILETAGVDLVLAGHSHSYERSYLLDGHYGVSSTLSPVMILDPGDGRVGGAGAYTKAAGPPVSHDGAVYIVAGSSGSIGGGALNHPAMFLSLNALGSLVLEVAGPQLNARFLDGAGVWRDQFTLYKGTGAPCTPGQPPGDQGDTLRLGPSADTIAWTRDPSSIYSNLYRGTIQTGSPASDPSCLLASTPAQSAADPTAPPLGSAFYYLVSGLDACGESVLGSSSQGAPIPNPAPCP